jgi:hypothetical protein
MISNDLAVHTISFAASHDPDSPLHNQLLVRTILQGHRDAQILGVRRLMDGRSDVVSLRRLLKEIKVNRGVFTREIYVAGGGLPYDTKRQSRDKPTTSSIGFRWSRQIGGNEWIISRRA